MAWMVHWVTIIFQFSMFIFFMLAPDNSLDNVDADFNMCCPGSGIECKDKHKVCKIAWVRYSMLIAMYLGREFALDWMQMRIGVDRSHNKLILSSLALVTLAGITVVTSIVYSGFRARTSTDVIANSVVLLFINDMDEKAMDILNTIAKTWIEERMIEAQKKLKSAFWVKD